MTDEILELVDGTRLEECGRGEELLRCRRVQTSFAVLEQQRERYRARKLLQKQLAVFSHEDAVARCRCIGKISLAGVVTAPLLGQQRDYLKCPLLSILQGAAAGSQHLERLVWAERI